MTLVLLPLECLLRHPSSVVTLSVAFSCFVLAHSFVILDRGLPHIPFIAPDTAGSDGQNNPLCVLIVLSLVRSWLLELVF